MERACLRLDLRQSPLAWIERRAAKQSKRTPPDDAGKPPGEFLHFHTPHASYSFFRATLRPLLDDTLEHFGEM
jgi:hypothetical protein